MGGSLIINVASAATTTHFRNKLQEFFEEYSISIEGSVPFGGRSEDLARLDRWLTDESAPCRLLLTGPAGRGKSALLVRWITSLYERGLVTDSETSWNVAFVPISARQSTNLPSVFYQALAKRLADILEQDLAAPLTDAGAYYADRAGDLLRELEPTGRRVLIVMDGLDEALGGNFNAGFVPRLDGSYFRIVLSARLQESDVDASGWRNRLRWDVGVRFQSIELHCLNAEGVADVLKREKPPLAELSDQKPVVDRLAYLTGGEAFLLRYYIEDLRQQKDKAARLTVQKLDSLTPGISAYFNHWIDDQEKIWKADGLVFDRRTVDATLAVLACAKGPLHRDDIFHLIQCISSRSGALSIRSLIDPVRRFVMGVAGAEAAYVLHHPILGIHLRSCYFFGSVVEATKHAFVAWGRKKVSDLDTNQILPKEVPPYLLIYYTAHLIESHAPPQEFMALISNGWRQAWEALDGGYQGFSRDVQLVWDRLRDWQAGDPERLKLATIGLGGQIRCVLCQSSIKSIGSNFPPSLLDSFVRERLITTKQALHLAELKTEEEKATALTALIPHLTGEARAGAVAAALNAAKTIPYERDRARALAALAPYLSSEERPIVLAKALATAETIVDEWHQADALAALAPHLTGRMLTKALKVAKAIDHAWPRADALAALAPRLTGRMLAEALEAAKSIAYREPRANALTAFAGRLTGKERAAVLSEALKAAKAIDEPHAQARALAALTPQLTENERPAVIAKALKAAKTITDKKDQAHSLAALVPHVTDQKRRAVIAAVLKAAKDVAEVKPRARALAALAQHLTAEERLAVIPVTLDAARKDTENASRSRALAALAHLLTDEERAAVLTEALEAGKAIHDDNWRADALAALASYLSEEERPVALAAALEAAKAVVEPGPRAHALATLAPHLNEEERPAVLAAALKAAKEVRREWPSTQLHALEAVAPHLTGALAAEALEAAKLVANDDFRALALAAVAPRVTERTRMAALAEALEAAKGTIHEWPRANALAALAPHLTGTMLAEAVDAAREIVGERARARALTVLVPFTDEEQRPGLLTEAIKATWAIADEWSWAEALEALAPHLTGAMPAEAEYAAKQIVDDRTRARALSALGRVTDEERQALLGEALKAAKAIADESYRSSALAALARHLSGTMLTEALEAAKAIYDGVWRADALAALAAPLSGEHKLDALNGMLEAAAKLFRARCLRCLELSSPAIAAVGGEAAVKETVEAVRDTAAWWP